MTAIILDGNLKSALAAVRSLGVKDVSISVGAERETGMALHSKYTARRFVYPSPYTDQAGFIATLMREAHECGDKPIVLSFSDATTLTLFAYRKELEECCTLVFPDEKSMEIAFDKAATYSLARVSGIPTITMYTPEFEEEVFRLGEVLSFPVVIKTRRSVTWKDGVGVFGTAQFIHSKEQLVTRFTELKKQLGEAPLIQELVYGEEYGVEMLVQNGRVFAEVVHHRLRSLSPTGGASVLKETIEDGDLKNSLTEYAHLLASKLLWTGPMMVEFKVDSDSRIPYLMEINGRFWGSLPLTVAAHADMPYLWYQYVSENEIPSEVIVGHAGVTTRHFLGDVWHLMKVFFSRDKIRARLYPRRWNALHDFFVLPEGTESDVWSWSDPKPAVMEIVDMSKKYIWKRKK